MSAWFDPLDDSLQRQGDHSICQNVNCVMLPLGYLLLLLDSYFDVCFVIWPSPSTARALRQYYTAVLTPHYRGGSRVGCCWWPGYWFPLFAICIMCGVCPNRYNYVLLVLFSLVAVRYVGILRGVGDLRYWWTVVGIRIVLWCVVTLEWRALDCYSQLMLLCTGWKTEL